MRPAAGHLGSRVVAGARRTKPPENVLEVHEEIRQRVVDLVGDACRQSPEGRHPVPLQQLMLELDPFGDVPRHDQHRRCALEFDGGGDSLGRPVSSLFSPPPKHEGLGGDVGGGRHEPGRHHFLVVRVEEVDQRRIDQLLGRQPDRASQSGVRVDDARVPVQEHKLGRDFDEGLEAGLSSTHRLHRVRFGQRGVPTVSGFVGHTRPRSVCAANPVGRVDVGAGG